MGNKTTICLVTLKNGFELVGTSACVDAANFDEAIGQKWAKKMAVDKITELEGYKLQCDMEEESEPCTDA